MRQLVLLGGSITLLPSQEHYQGRKSKLPKGKLFKRLIWRVSLIPIQNYKVRVLICSSATDSKDFLAAITRACHALIEAEPELTKQDQIAGDGDAGLTLEAGAKGILKAIKEGKIKGKNAIEDIGVIAEVVEEDMGGTSGALYS